MLCLHQVGLQISFNYKTIIDIVRAQFLTKSCFGCLIILGFLLTGNGLAKSHPTDSLAVKDIEEQASSINSVTSLLVQQEGQLLVERYLNGLSPGETTNIKSASKSIISLLVGLAIENGYIEGVGEPIKKYFPDYFSANPDSLKEHITIKDLLTMRSGLETTSFYNYGRWVVSDNWVEFALDQPLEAKPGGDMVYSTGTSHLLSVIISKATGMSSNVFAQKYLFGPMNIQVGGWDRDPQGYYMGGNNMALRPTDMLKIGQMVLNGGLYQGQRIISEQWLDASFKTYTRSNYNPYNYGYLWWKKPVGGYQVHFAWGFGGQYIFMIPDLNAVIVLTGALENATQQRSYKEPVFSLLGETIIPFLKTNDGHKH